MVGEARLSCRVYWSFANNSVALPVKAMFSVIGGCSSRRIGLYMQTDRPISQVTVSNWRHPVQIGTNQRSFRLPIYDSHLGNSERISVEYRD